MGESWSKFLTDYCDPNTVATNVRALVGRKRKHEEDTDTSNEWNLVLEKTLHTPKRKKLISTAQYIYQALFKEGKNSDITVIALGKQWKLHRVYLFQSPYFASMFSGSWREAKEDTVHIEIADPKINLDALYTVLGSLYLDEIVLEPIDVVSTLAAATLFQLEGIIDKCAEIMIETVNLETAVEYYDAGCEYGLEKVKEASFKWLLVNLLSHLQEHPRKLGLINKELMTKLVASPDLFVMQTEFSLYVVLRFWVYLQVNSQWEFNPRDGMFEAQVYFQNRQDERPFLLSREGRKFADTFKALRIRHLINHHLDIEMLKLDRVIPPDWLSLVVDQHWHLLLRVDQMIDRGPRALTYEEFSSDCLRCGRILLSEGEHMWRWTGFNCGLDLVWTCDSRVLKVKRNHRTEHEMLLSMQQRRHVMLRVTLASLDEQRQIKHTQSTGLKAISLYRNEEVCLLVLEKELKFPLLLSVNLTTTTPFVSSGQAVSGIDDVAQPVGIVIN